MKTLDLTKARLHHQHLVRPRFRNPAREVQWQGAVQAQDYAAAKWALGVRLRGATDDDVERAVADGSILRTHLLRPTWHFVTPADIRWMLALSAPQIHLANASYYRSLGLDRDVIRRMNTTLVRALQGGIHLTRDELRDALHKVGVPTAGTLRMSYIMMHAELDGLVCSGPRRGKQFTYALLDERAPDARRLERREALAELAGRYFKSRGPATIHDFAKWSGLKLSDARMGLDAIEAQLRSEVVDGRTYWFPTSRLPAEMARPAAHLLSVYDEYFSGYKEWSAIGDDRLAGRLRAMGNALNSIVLVDGRIVGTWKRALRKEEVSIRTDFLSSVTPAEERAVAAAAHQYGAFLGLRVVLA